MQLGLNRQLQPHEIKSYEHKIKNETIVKTESTVSHTKCIIYVRDRKTEPDEHGDSSRSNKLIYRSVLTAIFQMDSVSRYQNVSILDFIAAKDDGGGSDSRIYKTRRAPVKSSPTANQHPLFYRPDALPVAQPTVSEN